MEMGNFVQRGHVGSDPYYLPAYLPDDQCPSFASLDLSSDSFKSPVVPPVGNGFLAGDRFCSPHSMAGDQGCSPSRLKLPHASPASVLPNLALRDKLRDVCLIHTLKRAEQH